jgi:hypothetical protein
MRVLTILLVLLNLSYLAWSIWLAEEPVKDMLVRAPAVGATARLVLLNENYISQVDSQLLDGQGQGEGMLAQSEIVLGCFTVGSFLTQQLGQAFAASAQERGYKVEMRSVEVLGAPDYWVHLPPFVSEAAARRKLAELRSKSIDSYLITSGELNLGISLGLFSRQPLAVALRQRLAGLGYDSEILEVTRSYAEYWVDVQGVLNEQEWSDLLVRRPGLQRIEKLCETIAPGN